MDSLQRKGLEQAIKLLDSMSSYDGYKFLSEICKDAEEKKRSFENYRSSCSIQ